MTDNEKADDLLRRLGKYGIRPGTKFPSLYDAVMEVLDLVDRRVDKKDAEIEQLKSEIGKLKTPPSAERLHREVTEWEIAKKEAV